MANPGASNTTTPTGTPRANGGNSPIVTVILVVVLSILVLCVGGIGLVIHYRRRLKGKRYILLQASQDSSDATAIDDSSASNSRPDDAWNWLWRRINFLSASSPPDPYSPVQLPTSRTPTKVHVRLLDPNIPRTPPATNTPSPAPGRPTPGATPRLTPGPTPRPHHSPTLPTLLLQPPTPQSPIRHYTVPIPRVLQTVDRIAPLPDSSTPRPRPVRLPSGPLNLPTPEPVPPLRPPIEVVNIDRPANFTIDDSPLPSLRTGFNGGETSGPPRHGRSYSESNLITDRPQLLHSVTSPTGTHQSSWSKDSDSVREQRSPRKTGRRESFNQPISPVSDESASTTLSIAGSSRPPTLTFKSLWNSLNPARTVLPVAALMTPSSQLRRPTNQTAQGPGPSRSPPHYRTQFSEAHQQNQRILYTSQHPQYSRDQSRQHPSHTRQHSREEEIQRSPEPAYRVLPNPNAGNAEGIPRHGDQPHEHEPRRTNNVPHSQAEDGLFPGSVVGAGYQTKRVPKPLQPLTAETRRFPSTAAPPPTPNSWAQLRNNRI